MQKIVAKKIFRVIDANFNRAKEGLRVCEDICRFFLNNQKLTQEYKALRHELTGVVQKLKMAEVIRARDVQRDVGKRTIAAELKRERTGDIFYANSQRAKESIRVLEEFSKLLNIRLSQGLKKIRYKVYELEQKIVKGL